MKILTEKAWINILAELFAVDLINNLDSVIIDFDRLNPLLENIIDRYVLALEARYGSGLTFKEVGKVLHNDSVPIGSDRAMRLVIMGFRGIRPAHKMPTILAAFIGHWNLPSTIGPQYVNATWKRENGRWVPSGLAA